MKEVRAGRKPYPTDLTDSQWEEIEPLYSGMRNRKWSKRELTNAVLYIVKTGCQWRQLPHDFPPYQTVYSFFSRGAKSGLWEKILAHLVEKTRKEVRAGRKPYPTDLTDSQWEEIEPLYSGMRNRKWSKRELTNAVLYIVKTGCQWRQLPHDFPPYQTVYSFFSRGAKSGLWEKILAHLVEKTRKDAGKSAEPHYALIDSQSVKTVADNEARGIDGGKKQKGANGMPS